MKIIGIEDHNEKIKQLSKKKIMITSIIGTIIVITIFLFCMYLGNKTFRDFMDKYVLMKNVMENNLLTINIDENENNNIYAYDKYLSILNKNTLKGYNSSGKEEYELKVELTNPISSQNNRFLLLAEKDKQKIYLIESNQIVWEKELQGNISRISVNKNGYVSVVLTGTTYKSVIQTFDKKGNELFKTYLSNSIAIDTSISNDNKYLSFAEVNTDGTVLNTAIKTISIQKAKQQPSESIESSINPNINGLLIKIAYQEGNKLICLYDNSIYIIQNGTTEILTDLQEKDKKATFADINLDNHLLRVSEKSSFLNTETSVEIMNVLNKKWSLYKFNDVVKEIYCQKDKIAINLGSEVHFIGTNGWLIKKYISSQEIKKIVIGNNFSGIIYRNKIEIVEL